MLLTLSFAVVAIPQSVIRQSTIQQSSTFYFLAGLEHGLKTGKPAKFTVDCTEVGPGNLDIEVEGPGKGDIACDVEDNGDGTYTCTYKPTRPGTYIVKVQYDKIHVPKSPIKVTVSTSADLGKIKAWGPGLEKGKDETWIQLCSLDEFKFKSTREFPVLTALNQCQIQKYFCLQF